jgi:hypothetical protein
MKPVSLTLSPGRTLGRHVAGPDYWAVVCYENGAQIEVRKERLFFFFSTRCNLLRLT